MKILALVGSYRKNGNTAQVVDLIAEELQRAAARDCGALEIETLYLGHHDIRLCRGCRVCFDRGEEKCPLKDDLLAIKAKIIEADGLIVASPIYVDDVSGTMKNWIDRLAHVCHRPEFAGKCVTLVATTGGSPTGHAVRTLQTAMLSWGCYVVGEAGFKTGALMDRGEIQARYQGRIEKTAAQLYQAIRRAEFRKPSFYSLMVFKIQQLSRRRTNSPQDALDNVYWEEQGWTDPRREFYIDHDTSRAKVAFARLSGAVIARFVT